MWITPHRRWSKRITTRQAETEQQPAFEIHLGETHTDHTHHTRHAIVWLNGRRWEGDLVMQEAGT
jgi:hypothetical protein